MNNIDSKQFDFNCFLVASLIIWFFDEKERTKMKNNNPEDYLDNKKKNDKERAYFEKSNKMLDNHSPYKNENISILNLTNTRIINNESKNINNSRQFNNKSTANNNEINKYSNIYASNYTSSKNINKSNSKDKSNVHAINQKRINYGRDFDINHPECISMKNENKLSSFINAYFDTKSLIAFDKLIFDKSNFDIKVFSEVEAYLIENYMDNEIDIFVIDHDEKKYYMSKEKFARFLEFEFI
jgi:hypothetical protein